MENKGFTEKQDTHGENERMTIRSNLRIKENRETEDMTEQRNEERNATMKQEKSNGRRCKSGL